MIQSRFIAFADILGFRALIERSDLQTLAQRIDDWVAESRRISFSSGVGGEQSFDLTKIHFSDTVVLLSPPVGDHTSKESEMITKSFFMVLEDFILRTLLNGFPLRMGVSYGAVYVRDGTVLGKPVLEAYDVERAQEWVGGAVHPNCPVTTVLNSPHRELVQYGIPLKASAQVKPTLAINWTYLALFGKTFSGAELPMKNQVNEYLEKQLEQELPPDAKSKYQNTRKFWESEIIASGA